MSVLLHLMWKCFEHVWQHMDLCVIAIVLEQVKHFGGDGFLVIWVSRILGLRIDVRVWGETKGFSECRNR